MGETKNATSEQRLVALSGSLRTQLEYEQDPKYNDDLDLGTYLRLNVQPLLDERASFHFYGRFRSDLDSSSDYDDSLSRSDSRIFQSYLELERFPEPFRLRLGRQWVHEVEGVHLDGVRIDSGEWEKVEVTLFGGRPVSAYSSTDGEKVYGGAVGYRPFTDTLVRVTGVRSDEDHPQVDDQIGLHLIQRLGTASRLYADYNFLNQRGKEFRLGGATFIHPLQLDLTANYYQRVNRSPVPRRDDVLGRRFSEFFAVLGSSEELERYGVTATKYLGEHYAITGGFSVISILGEENNANRDTERYFLGLHFYDLFLENLHFSIEGNFARAQFEGDSSYTAQYEGGGDPVSRDIERDEETFFLSGQVEYQFHPNLKVTVGSAYGDYDFSASADAGALYSNELRELGREYLFSGLGGRFLTRTYFAELRWRMHERISTTVLAELDHSEVSTGVDSDDYLRIVTSVTYRF